VIALAFEQAEIESGAFARVRLEPDAAAVLLDDILADRQPAAAARVCLRHSQALEDLRKLFALAGAITNAK